ncbi:hypothetical protein LTR08_006899 [Meristemomyces frigidus]|nr:hypothetical protein LTR08_006899 [Meristemomyces frigidus]
MQSAYTIEVVSIDGRRLDLPAKWNHYPRGARLGDMTSVFHAVTFLLLALAFQQWARRSWKLRSTDALLALTCIALGRQQRPLLVLLATTLAAGYVVWTSLPDSSNSMDLPSYEDFMLSLPDTPLPDTDTACERKKKEEDCTICWDSSEPLVTLPCTHQFCKRCLGLLGPNSRATCPLCRHPLFQNPYVNRVLELQKLHLALCAVNTVLYAVALIYHHRRGEYWQAWTPVVMFATAVGVIYAAVGDLPPRGREWWRSESVDLSLFCRGLAVACTLDAFLAVVKVLCISLFE